MSSDRRLLTVLPGRFTGGVERYGLTVALAAAPEWEVHAAFPHTEANAGLIRAFGQRGIATHALEHGGGGPSALQVVVATARTMALLHRVKPSVVQVNVPLPTFALGHLIACALWRVPTVVVFHSTPPRRFDQGRSRRLYPFLRRRAYAWVAVSEHVRDALTRSFRISQSEVTVIPNGVPQAPEKGLARATVRRDLGISDDALLVLSVGRLGAEKGHADIISAAVEAARSLPRARFLLAGEGPERPRLEALIRKHRLERSVRLLGHRDDVDRLLDAADLFVFPSYWEGSPFALLEAASHSLPIISAEFQGSREVVDPGRSGILHAPGDSAALWRQLRYAAEHADEMVAMGEEAKRVADRFSQEAMVAATLALLADTAVVSPP